MSLVFLIYLAGVITSIAKFLSVIFASTCIFYALYVVGYLLSNVDYWHKRGKFYSWPITVILACGTIGAFLPSERTMWMMAGAYTGEKVMESNIGKQTLELIELKLAEELDVIKTKVKEKAK
jgi:FtsH-binding integral membrane protein